MIIVITQNPDGQFGCITEGADPAVMRAAITAVRDQLDAQFPELADTPPPPRNRIYLPTGFGQ